MIFFEGLDTELQQSRCHHPNLEAEHGLDLERAVVKYSTSDELDGIHRLQGRKLWPPELSPVDKVASFPAAPPTAWKLFS